MKDIHPSNHYNNKHIEELIGTIDEMTHKHDKNKDGLDFVEMYIASGGRLQDL